MTNRFDEAHRNRKGVTGLAAAIIFGTMFANSPLGETTFNALRNYVNEKVTVSDEYNGNSDTRQLAGYQDKHFTQEEYTR